MGLLQRSIWLCVLLGGGLVAQEGIRRHLEAAGPLPVVPLAKPLAQLPHQFQDWQGADRPIEDKRSLYGDEHLCRVYSRARGYPTAIVWMIYSREGADRGHHPEVCMAVAGKPEDPRGRARLAVPGHAAPVQQYRFGQPGASQLVYYWYYTLLPPQGSQVDSLQRLYQRMRHRPASLTIEVFAPEVSTEDAEATRQLVRLLDAALQPHLGRNAVRGSQALPVTVVEGN